MIKYNEKQQASINKLAAYAKKQYGDMAQLSYKSSKGDMAYHEDVRGYAPIEEDIILVRIDYVDQLVPGLAHDNYVLLCIETDGRVTQSGFEIDIN